MFIRILSALLGAFHGGNGLFMLLAPAGWYSRGDIPATGPFNDHFVQDVGAAFLAAGIAFLIYAWNTRTGLLALGASGFLLGHAVLHLIELGRGHGSALEFTAIAGPALLGAAIALPRKEIAHA